MNPKDTFYKDWENCKIPVYHIEEKITDPTLKKIDEIYGVADILSIENAKKHERNLWLLSAFGTIITILFLLYDEAELHLLIFGCIIIIVGIYQLYKLAERNDCHRKYIQYRVLAETLRVQYFLSKAGVKKQVTDILPWFIRNGLPWINEILLELPLKKADKKNSIINCWVRDQLEYHQNALVRTTNRKERDDRITKIVLTVTIATYIIAVIFEIYILTIPSGEITSDMLSSFLKSLQDWGIMVGFTPTDMVRSIMKIVIGTMSAATLFTGSYYGKMSLSNIIEDHRRMAMLYEKVENEILQNGETEELIITLAREFLIENSTWYSYQSKNTPNLTIE